MYLLYLYFLKTQNKNESNFNMFIELLFIKKFVFYGTASREWSLDIFERFCGGKLIRENSNNYCFNYFLVGHSSSGISNVNKFSQMPGREMFALEKFRNRMYSKYNINIEKSNNKQNNITIINSKRYNINEIEELLKVSKYFMDKDFNVIHIDWGKITNFRDQLLIMKDTDIHISGAGSSMLNFPFLLDNCIHINLGVSMIGEEKFIIPSLVEVNCCLLSNNIKCFYYDIYKHKNIIFYPLITLIENVIKKSKENSINYIIPKHVLVWRDYCKEKKEFMDKIIERMNNRLPNHLMGLRHPDFISYCPTFCNEYNFDNKLLTILKKKYNII